jgi:hypothetical protein
VAIDFLGGPGDNASSTIAVAAKHRRSSWRISTTTTVFEIMMFPKGAKLRLALPPHDRLSSKLFYAMRAGTVTTRPMLPTTKK